MVERFEVEPYREEARGGFTGNNRSFQRILKVKWESKSGFESESERGPEV